MAFDVVTLALGIATGQLLYDLIASLFEIWFGSKNDSNDDDDKGAYGW